MTEPNAEKPVDCGLPDELTEHEQLINNQVWISRQVDHLKGRIEFLKELVDTTAKETEHGVKAKLSTMEDHGHSLEERVAGVERLLQGVANQCQALRAGVERIVMLLLPAEQQG